MRHKERFEIITHSSYHHRLGLPKKTGVHKPTRRRVDLPRGMLTQSYAFTKLLQ